MYRIVDYAGLQWDACPVGWKGMHKGMDKKPTCRIEVVFDDSLRIWHVEFGMPGAKNDPSLMGQSSFFNDIRNDVWASVRPQQCVTGYQLRQFNVLTDGIYPSYVFFTLPHINPHTRMDKSYSAHHSTARKAVKRLFGVLTRQFRILYLPSRLWHVSDMVTVVKACCILHNMIGNHRGYAGTMEFFEELYDAEEQVLPLDVETVATP